jgi:hypothetical protein
MTKSGSTPPEANIRAAKILTSADFKCTFAPLLRPLHASISVKKVKTCMRMPGRAWAKRYNQGESNSYRIHGKDA